MPSVEARKGRSTVKVTARIAAICPAVAPASAQRWIAASTIRASSAWLRMPSSTTVGWTALAADRAGRRLPPEVGSSPPVGVAACRSERRRVGGAGGGTTAISGEGMVGTGTLAVLARRRRRSG